jgi:D-3-phosphoglycerate dehydrogenase
MLSLSRHIAEANQSVKANKWERNRFIGTEVYKKNLGVVGLGKIGSHVAKVAKSLGMKILAYNPFISKEQHQSTRLHPSGSGITLCRVRFYHPPRPENCRNPASHRSGNHREDETLVNASLTVPAGGIIDELALIEALESGKVARQARMCLNRNL